MKAKKIFFSVFIFLSIISSAQFTKLYEFSGIAPAGKITWYNAFISDGTFLYANTVQGGTVNAGTIFKIKPDGTGYTTLHDFMGNPSGDGTFPYSALISIGTDLYGMSEQGNFDNTGTIYKINMNGTGYTILHAFPWIAGQGYAPRGSLFYDGTFLYGVTGQGGTNNMGTFFRIMPNGTGFTKLYDFADGNAPRGALVSDGTFLYGMTRTGGTSNFGIIYKIMPDGTGYTKLYDFTGNPDGKWPNGDLLFVGGVLYGMTINGGTSDLGIIFKINTNGTGFTKLLDFAGATNGRNPFGYLISNGGTTLYGLTSAGGANDAGTIFRIKTDGTNYANMFDFTTGAGGSGTGPFGSLYYDGTCVYGMNNYGAANSWGAIYSLCGTILPVELLYFNAGAENNSKVKCTWSTASELNNEYFAIERSRDGINFEEIGKVQGAGNSSTALQYEYDDLEPCSMAYYRLKQVDFDGAHSYSSIVPVVMGGFQFINFYPAASGDDVIAEIGVNENSEATIEVFSTLGQRAIFKEVQLTKGQTQVNINVSQLAQGTYMFRANLPDKEKIQKIFVR